MTNHEPWAQWITRSDIDSLHEEGLLKGGKASPEQTGCVDGALGAAYNAELYVMPEIEGEQTISGIVFCGCLLFYLITKNCWVDGNKRVGWLAAMYVLLKLGLIVQASDDEAEAFCLAVAAGAIKSANDTVNWLAEHLAAVD